MDVDADMEEALPDDVVVREIGAREEGLEGRPRRERQAAMDREAELGPRLGAEERARPEHADASDVEREAVAEEVDVADVRADRGARLDLEDEPRPDRRPDLGGEGDLAAEAERRPRAPDARRVALAAALDARGHVHGAADGQG